MDKNYVVYHLHTMLSNAFTVADSITSYEDYVDRASELGMKAIAFTEHGNALSWLKKKEYVESKGMKYIHGIEAYVTMTLEEKVRDNYHVVLLAKNHDGFKELNELYCDSKAFNKHDGHYYYNPRITMEELENTSDNIIVTSACLGSPLNSNNKDDKVRFMNFLIKNKDRCFLEIQHHNVKDQKTYNEMLLKVSQKTGVRLIAGTDTHCLNKEHEDGREIFQKSKFIHFDNEDGWDLTFKSYDELVWEYEKQKSLSEAIFLDAINNTNVLADMVEEFEVDRNPKYPRLFQNPKQELKNKIAQYMKEKNIELDDVKKERIAREIQAYEETDSIDYILLEEKIKRWCREQGIAYGYGRGSVTGSWIAYLLGITDMDSIKHNLVFERFINKDRVSLCDIDTDYSPKDREKVKNYVYGLDGVYCADIITFNTIAIKGAIRDVGRALGMALPLVDEISKQVEDREEEFREQYPKLFKYVDLLNGVVVSVGSHPAGIVVSPTPLEGDVGTCSLKSSENPVTVLNMKEIDSTNRVKLDILGLDNVAVIEETCKLAELEIIKPDNIDVEDKKVWDSIRDSTFGVFQWGSNSAWSVYKDLFSDSTLEKIKAKNPNISHMDLFSVGNAVLRPAGESYRDRFVAGEFNDNGNEALNDFLANTQGYLCYQEQILQFFNEFCGIPLTVGDNIRRGFSKKLGTAQYLPMIEQGFVKTMGEKYGLTEDESKSMVEGFLEVIDDASSYGFSINHSLSYSYIGYTCAWLRYYYPLEFLTAYLNENGDVSEKRANAMNYMNNHTDITLKPIEFGFSKARYNFSKEDNAIFQDISSIKFLNSQVADELYALSKEKDYRKLPFPNLLSDIVEKTSANSRQIQILIKLDFFKEFGNNKKILDFYEMFEKLHGKKQIKKDKVKELGLTHDILENNSKQTAKLYKEIDIDKILRYVWSTIPDKRLDIKEQISAEVEYLGYIVFKEPTMEDSYYFVSEFKTYSDKSKPYLMLYRICDGKEIKSKVVAKERFERNPFQANSIIKIDKDGFKESFKKKQDANGDWYDTNEKQYLTSRWEVLY